MRDFLMNEQYFSEYIQEETKRINKFMSKLENNEVKEDRIYPVKKKIDSMKFGLLIAKYSLGEDIYKLKEDFIELLNDMPLFWNKDSSYVDMLWMMSLAILFDVNTEQFNILADLVKKYNFNDALLDFFINFKSNGIVTKTNTISLFGAPYDKLLTVINDDANCIDGIKEYLEKYWYIGHKKMGWYDIHKAKEKLYYGYWSFETGAITKIFDLDDNRLKDVKYYPYDLVQFSRKII